MTDWREALPILVAQLRADRAAALADAVQRLYDRLVADPYALCQAARTRAELYSWDTSAQLMLDAHRDVSPD